MHAPISSGANKTFPLAPVPYPGESLGSWVQRLCGSHFYSFARLSLVTGLKPLKQDWDLGLFEEEALALVASAGLTRMDLEKYFDGVVGKPVDELIRTWARHSGARPSYGWCARCFSSDVDPYLRWAWRLTQNKSCEIHDVELHTECRHCGRALETHRSLMTTSVRAHPIYNLASCSGCGFSLVDDVYLAANKKSDIKPANWQELREAIARLPVRF